MSRINPPEDWIVAEVPELRIVDDALWKAVKDRQGEIAEKYGTVIEATQTARANRLNGAHRPRHLLSGLLECGVCGGPYSMRGQRFNPDRRGTGHREHRRESHPQAWLMILSHIAPRPCPNGTRPAFLPPPIDSVMFRTSEHCAPGSAKLALCSSVAVQALKAAAPDPEQRSILHPPSDSARRLGPGLDRTKQSCHYTCFCYFRYYT